MQNRRSGQKADAAPGFKKLLYGIVDVKTKPCGQSRFVIGILARNRDKVLGICNSCPAKQAGGR